MPEICRIRQKAAESFPCPYQRYAIDASIFNFGFRSFLFQTADNVVSRHLILLSVRLRRKAVSNASFVLDIIPSEGRQFFAESFDMHFYQFIHIMYRILVPKQFIAVPGSIHFQNVWQGSTTNQILLESGPVFRLQAPPDAGQDQ